MGKASIDQSLLLILAQLKNADEDAKTRQKVRRLTPAQAVEMRKLLKRRDEQYLFPTRRFYVRRDRRDGQYYLVRSRRIGSDNLLRRRGKPVVGRGAII